MKKILFVVIVASLFSVQKAHAMAMDVWLSSNTQTADTTKNLCNATTSYVLGTSTVTFGNHSVFHAFCVNTGAAGSLSIFNSNGVVSSTIAVVNTAAAMPCSLFDIQTSSGLTYTNSATANVTILYQCY